MQAEFVYYFIATKLRLDSISSRPAFSGPGVSIFTDTAAVAVARPSAGEELKRSLIKAAKVVSPLPVLPLKLRAVMGQV